MVLILVKVKLNNIFLFFGLGGGGGGHVIFCPSPGAGVTFRGVVKHFCMCLAELLIPHPIINEYPNSDIGVLSKSFFFFQPCMIQLVPCPLFTNTGLDLIVVTTPESLATTFPQCKQHL